MNTFFLKPLLFIVSVLLFIGCSEDSEPKMRMAVFEEPASTECQLGGLRVGAGIDVNENGRLDKEEVTSSQVVCHVKNEDGVLSMTAARVTKPFDNFKLGGFSLTQGFDDDKSGMIDRLNETVWAYSILYDPVLGVFIKARTFYLGESFGYESGVLGERVFSNFNVEDYQEYDQGYFNGGVYNRITEQTFTFSLQLFNLTDGIPMEGGAFERTLPGGLESFTIDSEIALEMFPQKPIDLGLRLVWTPEDGFQKSFRGQLTLIRNID